MHALQDLARRLIELPDTKLRKLRLDEGLVEEIVSARDMKLGARKR